MARTTFQRYGLNWRPGISDVEVEIAMIRHGGQWLNKAGMPIGNGLFFHYKHLQELLWPEKVWHRWNELQLEQTLQHRTIGVIGPASSGKTHEAATFLLSDYYCFPECTTVIICSTTKERLEDRIFGEMKKHHRMAKKIYPFLPGHLIEGRLRIVSDSRDEISEGRDFRSGVVGVPCKRGGDYVGLGDFIGIKNKRVRMAADELQLMPSSFIMAISNLDKNLDLKVLGLGNPKETTDALGVFCEPEYAVGGWDGGIDQVAETKTWKTRRPDGVCIQLVGSDSPNLDGQLGIPLITQSAIDRDIAQYGKDSLQFTMMNQGMMPRGQGSRRVLTPQLCRKNHAFDDPQWLNSERTRIGFLDAAYGGVGGDRCMFGELQFGYEAETLEPGDEMHNVGAGGYEPTRHKQVMALVDLVLVPINVKIDVSAEDQITNFVHQQCSTRNIPPQNFFYDAGMKSTLVSAMSRLWSPQTNPIDFGGSPTDRPVGSGLTIREGGRERPKRCNEHYLKYVTELWFSVRLVVESGQFRGMRDSVMQEGCQREWTLTGSNKIEVETKVKMKEKTGRSPDQFDALAAGVEGARRLGFIISIKNAKPAGEKSDAWKRQLRERSMKSHAAGQLDYTT